MQVTLLKATGGRELLMLEGVQPEGHPGHKNSHEHVDGKDIGQLPLKLHIQRPTAVHPGCCLYITLKTNLFISLCVS